MDFMHEGGASMWATGVLFLLGAATAVARRRIDGWRVAVIGAVACIASGLTGFATGLYATVSYVAGAGVERSAAVLSAGLRESVHNVLWAGILAFALGVLALALLSGGRQPERSISRASIS